MQFLISLHINPAVLDALSDQEKAALGGASDRLVLHGSFTLCGAERPAGPDRVLDTPAVIGEPS